ncbi:hypothetical protein DICVIV_12019 [Dictyocaulus viviparus]|uniref:Uncharacterized protein n=1 Tax=Dictyocaulus viviparus TaxID=29172 RepID=A0A0D8XBL2_DICVI|nr:hypothetical protein DICVIV_12019 [Dictyocaulus viviparus]
MDESTVVKLVQLLQIGGKLILPFRNSLMAYKRTSETAFTSEVLMACQFADLLPPTPDDRRDCLPCLKRPPSLADLCRNVIRETLRVKVSREFPIFMRSVITDSNVEESVRPDNDTEMGEEQQEESFSIIRHPIRVGILRDIGAARIRLEGFDRTGYGMYVKLNYKFAKFHF